jgi:UDP-2,3-diacylglucosamine hydrolase
MQQFGVRTLIHGHTHRPAIHKLQIGDQAAKRIVLGDWDRRAGRCRWMSKGFVGGVRFRPATALPAPL